MKYFSLFVILFLAVLNLQASAIDSVGVEKRNGKMYIVHRVDAGETLYGLTKKYKVDEKQIREANSGLKEGLKMGTTIYIPMLKKVAKSVHTVKAGETLFSISKQYKVTIDQIKKWNGLTSDELSLGQTLKIGGKAANAEAVKNEPTEVTPSIEAGVYHTVVAGEGLFSISKKYDVSIEEIQKLNSLEGTNISVGQKLLVKKADAASTTVESTTNDQTQSTTETQTQEEVPDVTPTVKVEANGGFDLITENGLASAIEDSEDTRKYLALHRTAKAGTIIKVRNEMNNQQVFVRVLGKLPDTVANKKYVIKISKAAYDRLGAIDKYFRVELTYTK